MSKRSKKKKQSFPNSYVIIYCLVAALLVFGAIALLRWNEQDAGKESRAQEALSEVCLDMADPGRIDPSLDGKLVYAKGKAVSHELLTDEEFGVSARGIALHRASEYYQWVEKLKKEPPYDKKWVGSPVDSRLFKDKHYRNKNTVYREVPNGSVLSDNVMFGAYRLSEEFVRRISTTEKVDEKYLSKHDMSFAQIGDVRVTFSRAPEEVAVTIVGKVEGGTIVPYQTDDGGTYCAVKVGDCDKLALIETAAGDFGAFYWIVRVLGIVMLLAAAFVIYVTYDGIKNRSAK